MTGAVHISAPKPLEIKRIVKQCPWCERRTRQVGVFFDWFGWNITCCSCGECWEGGEGLPHPFERGWRKRRIAEAKALWRNPTVETYLAR
jgi:hypothetical protein